MQPRPLRTTVLGSHPIPSWLEFSCQHLGEFGKDGLAELQDDAVSRGGAVAILIMPIFFQLVGALAEALEALAKADCPLLLIGGNALPAFGYSRATVDVDCLIAAASTERLKEVLAENGFSYAGTMAAFHEFWHHGNSSDPPVHAMFVDAATFDKMWSRSIPAAVSGIPLRVPCLAHLIALKLFAMKSRPARTEKDLPDICVLLETNPGVVPRAELAEICERYASQAAVERLRSAGFL